MSRQLEIEAERRTAARNSTLIKALEFGIVGALESQGLSLLGIAIKYSDYDVLLTLKVDAEGKRLVAFIGSDTIPNAFLKLYGAIQRNDVHYRIDQYTKD